MSIQTCSKYFLLILVLVGCNYQLTDDRNGSPLLNSVPEVKVSTPSCSCPEISVKFSPNGGAEEALVGGIDEAEKTIMLQAYSFTATKIADALVRAKMRGVDVNVILDREATGNPHSVAKYLKASGISVMIDGKHAIAHNKIIIIDNKTVFTGSYNFSNGANLKNAENSIKIIDAKLAKTYSTNWSEHRAHSTLLP